PSRLVLNKCDKLQRAEVSEIASLFPDAIEMSAKSPEDVRTLRDRLVEFFEEGMIEAVIFVPHGAYKAVGQFHSRTKVLEESHTESGTRLTVRGDEAEVARIKQQFDL